MMKERDGQTRKTVKMAVLLPVAAAIGTKTIIQNEKIEMLENNTLEAVFTLPNEIFYQELQHQLVVWYLH